MPIQEMGDSVFNSLVSLIAQAKNLEEDARTVDARAYTDFLTDSVTNPGSMSSHDVVWLDLKRLKGRTDQIATQLSSLILPNHSGAGSLDRMLKAIHEQLDLAAAVCDDIQTRGPQIGASQVKLYQMQIQKVAFLAGILSGRLSMALERLRS